MYHRRKLCTNWCLAPFLVLLLFLSGCDEADNNNNDSKEMSITSVTIAPADDPGSAFVGTGGTLNYTITVNGKNITSFALVEVAFVVKPAAGVTIKSGAVTAANKAMPFSVLVDSSFTTVQTLKLSLSLFNVVSSEADLIISELNPITGNVTMTALSGSLSSPDIGTELKAAASGLPEGAVPVYRWVHGEAGAENSEFELIPGAAGDTHTITAASSGLIIKAAVSSSGFNGYIYSNPTASPTPKTVARQIKELRTASSQAGHTIQMVYAEEQITPQILDFAGAIAITLKGKAGGSILQLSGMGAMFTIGPQTTLILEDVTLRGINANRFPVVILNGGTLTMNADSAIRGNENQETEESRAAFMGGGVIINSGKLVMNDNSLIENNRTATDGGGVLNHGALEIRGGKISGNTSVSKGGGVANYGRIDMHSGEISSNVSVSNTGGGGGVFNFNVFYMYDGLIADNTSTVLDGGGVYNSYDGLFVLQGGELRCNTSGKWGGAVRNMNLFAMTGGVIAGNTASSGSGGVENTGSFYIQKGILYGTDADNQHDANKSLGSSQTQDVLFSASNAKFGLFKTNDYSDFSQGNFESNGALLSTSLTIYVEDGLLVNDIFATSLTIQNIADIDSSYIGKTAILAYIKDIGSLGRWIEPKSQPLTVTGTTDEFIFLRPVSAGPADLTLEIIDLPLDQFDIEDYEYKEIQAIAGFNAVINLQPNKTVVDITIFKSTVQPATSMTITNIPAGTINDEWVVDLYIYDLVVGWMDEEPLDSLLGPHGTEIIFTFYDPVPAGIRYFGLDFSILVDGEWYYEPGTALYFQLELVTGDDNTITWQELMAQQVDPHPGKPSMANLRLLKNE